MNRIPTVRGRNRVSILALVLPLCSLSAKSVAQGEVRGWESHLALSTAQVVPEEPLLATCTMRYNDSTPFLGYADLCWAGLLYRKPSGETSTSGLDAMQFGVRECPPPPRAITYNTGYQRRVEVMVLYRPYRHAAPGGFVLSESGRGAFELQLNMLDGAGPSVYRSLQLTSALVPITVLPLPQKEQGAFALWSGPDKARMFLTGEREAGTEADLRALVERYPDSAYAKYALMALAQGKRWQRGFLGIVVTIMTDAVRDEQKRLAAEEVALLEQVVQRYGTFHLSPVVLDRIIEVASSPLGDWGRAEKYAKMLLALENAPQSFRRRAEQALDAASRVRAAGKAD